MYLSGYIQGVWSAEIIQNTFLKKQARKVQRTNYSEKKQGKPDLQMQWARNIQAKCITKGKTTEARQRKLH